LLEEELNQNISKMYPAQREAYETITQVALRKTPTFEQKLFFIDGPGNLIKYSTNQTGFKTSLKIKADLEKLLRTN
jgi:hypothetical protein